MVGGKKIGPHNGNEQATVRRGPRAGASPAAESPAPASEGAASPAVQVSITRKSKLRIEVFTPVSIFVVHRPMHNPAETTTAPSSVAANSNATLALAAGKRFCLLPCAPYANERLTVCLRDATHKSALK